MSDASSLPAPAARPVWSGRVTFILAAVGSAIGLGNVWRFPYVAYKNGGGAFLIPYLFALFAIGIPLLIMELGMGQMTQSGAITAWRRQSKKWEWIGWFTLFCALMIMFYYSVVMSWSFIYLWHSLKAAWTALFASGADAALPWAGKETEFFFSDVLRINTPGEFGGLVVPIVIGSALTWFAVWLSIRRGVHSVGKVVWVTVFAPVVIILILLVRGLTLPGAGAGLAAFFKPDFSKLKEINVWSAAVGQVFFSLSVGFGVMIAYASHQERESEVSNSAMMTAFLDCGFSFIAGITVFAALGYLANVETLSAQTQYNEQRAALSGLIEQANAAPDGRIDVTAGQFGLPPSAGSEGETLTLTADALNERLNALEAPAPVAVDKVAKSGPGLAFVVFPSIIAKLPGGVFGNAIFAILFFLMLLTLGIDSLFSIVEAVAVGVHDRLSGRIKRSTITIALCVIGFIFSLAYSLQSGLYWLDIVDHWINDMGLALVGLFQCVVLGWFIGTDRLKAFVSRVSELPIGFLWECVIKILAPAALGSIAVLQFGLNIISPYGGYPEWMLLFAGWGVLLFGFEHAFVLSLMDYRQTKQDEIAAHDAERTQHHIIRLGKIFNLPKDFGILAGVIAYSVISFLLLKTLMGNEMSGGDFISAFALFMTFSVLVYGGLVFSVLVAFRKDSPAAEAKKAAANAESNAKLSDQDTESRNAE
ncbi:MAG: sodium-dependent transporter [Planctomycetota bacterium]